MERYIGLDVHARSCTLVVVSGSGMGLIRFCPSTEGGDRRPPRSWLGPATGEILGTYRRGRPRALMARPPREISIIRHGETEADFVNERLLPAP